MNYQKVIIIDDNTANIKDLKDELIRFEHLKIIGQATMREQAIRLIKQENPDIVFLDIQLDKDGITGFDLLRELKTMQLVNFVIVFYTAYEKYAIEAIRASAFDFLLKPIDPIQLSIIISRLQNNPVFNTNINIERLINQISSSPKIALQTVQGFRLVKLQSIVFISVENIIPGCTGHIVVYLIGGEKVKLSGNLTLSGIQDRLNDSDFFRISRQSIINIHYLEEVDNPPSNICRMTNPFQGVKLRVSRNHMQELRRKFSLS